MAPGPPVEALSCICPACDVLLVSVLTQGHVLMGNDLRMQKLPLFFEIIQKCCQILLKRGN